ncbi:hypothetical protein Tco_0777834, partial [Tanacetum coccineum]
MDWTWPSEEGPINFELMAYTYSGNPIAKNCIRKRVFDSGMSRYMTGNKSYLLDYEEIDGGFVAFRGDPKGGVLCRKDYSTIVKALQVLTVSRTRIVEENLHVKFSEDTPNIVGSGPNWLFDIDALTKSMNYGPVVTGNQSNGSAGVGGKARNAKDLEMKIVKHVSDGHSIPLLNDAEADDFEFTYIDQWIGSLIDSPFDLEAFSDSDYAGASLDRKSTTGGCQFLGRRLISWQCKKQTIVANSTTEAEYVATANCCGHVLWIQNQLLDYGYNFMNTQIFIDNESTICIVKNLVFHSKTKHRCLEWNKTAAKDEFQVSDVRVTYYWQVYLMLLVAFNAVVKIKNVKPIKQKKAKRTTEISQSSGPIPLVIDETVIKEWEDRMERAATTASSLEAEQDSGNINRTQSMATLNESFPWGTDLEKPEESNGFEGISDFLNASSIRYALTVNPIVYEYYIKQFWATAKAKTKKSKRKQRKDSGPTEPIPDDATNEEPISTPSCDPPQSGEDRLQLTGLMSLCTKLQKQVLDLKEAKNAQAKEIASLKKRVKQLEKRRKSETSGLKRLRKVGSTSRVEFSNDVSLGAQEDASKQGRKIADLDDDAEEVSAADPVTTTGEVVTTANVEVTTTSAPTTTINELTLAQTVIEIKAAKPKAVTT